MRHLIGIHVNGNDYILWSYDPNEETEWNFYPNSLLPPIFFEQCDEIYDLTTKSVLKGDSLPDDEEMSERFYGNVISYCEDFATRGFGE